jgi:hypothetical protein
MHRKHVIIAATATGVIVGLGILSRVSPGFKSAATDVSLTLLVALVLSGLLGALIVPLLDLWSEPGPERHNTRSYDAHELITVGRAPHTEDAP